MQKGKLLTSVHLQYFDWISFNCPSVCTVKMQCNLSKMQVMETQNKTEDKHL
jgi:hypothetical protein